MSKKNDEPIVLDLTQSRLGSFLTCPRKEYYQYRAGGVGIKPTTPFLPFLEGEFGHYALAHYHRKGRMLRVNLLKKADRILDRLRDDLGAKYTSEMDDRFKIALAAISGACIGYKQRYVKDKDRYEILYVEEPFQLELEVKADGKPYLVVIRGRLDRVVRDKETEQVIVWENKFMGSLPDDYYRTIPLNMQGLVYILGTEALVGEMPDARQWDFIIKSKLRRKQTKSGGRESMLEYESRVTQQYLDEPEKKFFRFPPQKVLKGVVVNVEAQLTTIIAHMINTIEGRVDAYMNWQSCLGMYGQACSFASACTSKLGNHKDGWDAAENQGMYVLKKVLHEELREDDDDGED